MAEETRYLDCIVCPLSCRITACLKEGQVLSVSGNTCPRGEAYAREEVTAPKRMLTSTVQIKGGILPLLPVVSAAPLPKERIMDCAVALRGVVVTAPVKLDDVIIENILGLGVNILASRSMTRQ